MNYIIVISFVVFILSVLITIFPRVIALRIAGINHYDLQSVPKAIVYTVFVCSIVIMTVSLAILLQQISTIDLPLPEWNYTLDLLG